MSIPTPPAPTPEEIAAVVGTTQRWWKDAECLDATIDGFDNDDGSPEAKAACSRCPVRLHCLADEVRHPTDWVLGFRGGLPAPERRVLITRASALG